MSDSFRPHGLQHAKLPCPSPSPGACSNACPLSWWCHPTISSSVVPFSSHPQSFPASGSFQMSQLFASGGRSTGVSVSTSVLPTNTQDWSDLLKNGLFGSPCSPRDSQESSPTPQFKSINSLVLIFLIVQYSHPYMTTGKTIKKVEHCGVGKDSCKSLGLQGISNQSILKEISPEYSLEGLRLNLQYFGHLMERANSLENTLMLGISEGTKIKGH